MNDESKLQIVNTSGFPFQMRVAHEIATVNSPHGWRVLAQERLWRGSNSADAGFVDVIAGFGIVRLVIECKRGADSTWIFLVQASSASDTVPRVRALCTAPMTEGPDLKGWADLAADPSSYESAFCVVKGQADKEPMLERTATGLLAATEGYAETELSLQKGAPAGADRVYIPVIVTAASLHACILDPVAVDVESGRVPVESVKFEPVEFIRFRKEMASAVPSHGGDAEAARKDAERTVLVVQARSLAALLKTWNLRTMWGEEWPHRAWRDRARWLKDSQGAG